MWIWILLSLLLLIIIAIIVVVVLLSGKCKKGFEKSFEKYGDCFFDAAKKNCSGKHFKQICQIVQHCPDQLKACGTAVLAAVKAGTTIVEPDGSLNPDIVKACPNACVAQYIDVEHMSQEEQDQWTQEMTNAAKYITEHCAFTPKA
jgi:hypothetical protein